MLYVQMPAQENPYAIGPQQPCKPVAFRNHIPIPKQTVLEQVLMSCGNHLRTGFLRGAKLIFCPGQGII